jgi:hypothetical protein
MSRAVFVAAAGVGRVHPSDWVRALATALDVANRSVGLFALLASAGLAAALAHANPGPGRRAFAAAGTAGVGVALVLAALPLGRVGVGHDVELAAGSFVLLSLVFLAGTGMGPRERRGGWVDAALWTYLAGEVTLTALLFRASTGAWINYALQAVVLGSVLTARALARGLDGAAPRLALLPVVLAAPVVPLAAVLDVLAADEERRTECFRVDRVVEAAGRPRGEFFFVDLPGENRLGGRTELVYDPWLYPVFESLRQAEPRALWLRRALESGPVRVVVTGSPSPHVDGLGATLPELGYRPTVSDGRFFAWRRD